MRSCHSEIRCGGRADDRYVETYLRYEGPVKGLVTSFIRMLCWQLIRMCELYMYYKDINIKFKF